MVHPGAGKHTWNLTTNLSLDGITLARHAAPSEDGRSAATVATLARRAQGRSLWGVLRGDVDSFGVRLRRLTSIEEHVQLSVLYKQFFAGELEVLMFHARILAQGHHPVFGRRRFRGVRKLGRLAVAGARSAAPVPSFHAKRI